jgi:hypothetical protein
MLTTQQDENEGKKDKQLSICEWKVDTASTIDRYNSQVL